MSLPPLPDNREKSGAITNTDGSEHSFNILDEICQRQSNLPEKAICLQQLRYDHNHKIEYRLCYYMHKAEAGWVFGRFAALVPPDDLQAIFEKAREKGWVT